MIKEAASSSNSTSKPLQASSEGFSFSKSGCKVQERSYFYIRNTEGECAPPATQHPAPTQTQSTPQGPPIDLQRVLLLYRKDDIVHYLHGLVWPGASELVAVRAQGADSPPGGVDEGASEITGANIVSVVDEDVFGLEVTVSNASVMDCG
ncbi:hypothetical protein DXG01_000845 [Tephrocybe rancida]|nr:hypothetical protein DXG01_000845 [Tephrocybe rancida]